MPTKFILGILNAVIFNCNELEANLNSLFKMVVIK